MKIAVTATMGAVGDLIIEGARPDQRVLVIAPPVPDVDRPFVDWPRLANWEREALTAALRGCDVLFHGTSVEVRDRRPASERSSWHLANGQGRACAWHADFVLRLYDAASAAGVKRFILWYDDLMPRGSHFLRSSAEIAPGAVHTGAFKDHIAVSRRIVMEVIRRRFSTVQPAALTIVRDAGRWGDPDLDGLNIYDFIMREVEFVKSEVWPHLGMAERPASFAIRSDPVDGSFDGVHDVLHNIDEGLLYLLHK